MLRLGPVPRDRCFEMIRHFSRTILLLALLLFPGCAGPQIEFPLGLYGVPPEAFPEVKAAGFNLVTGPATMEFLEAAAAHNLGVVAFSGAQAIQTNAARRATVNQLDKHRALWAWYLIDEPDLHRIPPARVEEVWHDLQRLAFKPSLLVLKSGSAVAHYGQHSDLLAVDFYPVPWAPLAQFSQEMKFARLQRGEKPYYAILQAFDWAAFPGLLDTTVPLRTPTLAELRCMVYMALAQEADGLFFYSYHAAGWHLPDHELWLGVKALATEVRRLQPLFTAEHLWWSPALEYLDGGDAMYNEVRGPRIMLSLLRVKTGNADIPPGDYVLALNTTPEIVPFRLELPGEQEGSVPVAGHPRVQPLYGSLLRKDFDPWEVAIYGPLRPSSATSAQ